MVVLCLSKIMRVVVFVDDDVGVVNRVIVGVCVYIFKHI